MGRCGADGRFALELWCAVDAKAFEALPTVPLLRYSTSTSTCICTRITRAVACLPRLELAGANSRPSVCFSRLQYLFLYFMLKKHNNLTSYCLSKIIEKYNHKVN